MIFKSNTGSKESKLVTRMESIHFCVICIQILKNTLYSLQKTLTLFFLMNRWNHSTSFFLLNDGSVALSFFADYFVLFA